MAKRKSKTIPLDQVIDENIGKVGTPERDEFEKELQKEIDLGYNPNPEVELGTFKGPLHSPIIVGTAGEMSEEDLINFKKLAESHELGVKTVNSLGEITTSNNGDFITIASPNTFTGPSTNGFVQDDNTPYQNAISRVTEELKKDPEMYFAFQSNIAMPFVDVYHRVRKSKGSQLTHQDIHEIANEAAKQFLDLLIK